MANDQSPPIPDSAIPGLTIAGRRIGPGEPPYVIAELSANHNGSIDRALASIDAAKAAGADAVKIQSYTADTITLDCDRPEFAITTGPWAGRTLYDLYQEAYTPFEWHPALFARARDVGITLFSTPFDFTAVDMLEALGAPAYKIASFELVDLPLIRRVARTGKPVIMSTGMASLEEIGEAVTAAREAGCRELALLHCISSYPAPVEAANLRTLGDLAVRFGVTAGLSDHTMGTVVSVAAVAQGAALIEKHFMLDRDETGPDSAFSLTSEELRRLCDDTRTAWTALGRVNYERPAAEAVSAVHRRSLYFVADIKAGEEITPSNLRSIRPGAGLAPRHYEALLGRRAARDIARGTPATFDDVER
jgi:N-acetylneuraminate synthase